MNYKDIYDKSALFRLYVEKYAKQNKISIEEALKHKVVQYVGERYAESEVRELGRTSITNHRCGC